ncbi:MAG: DUF3168 domain-containing protein [Mesorhizobium sp.]|uniref:DUF3168 domain-containing protein n=1 Tax=Mesorhizobium sp. M7A.F.Ca.ET.027.02.1.1 TaxID=2496655 RepID=UPI000FD37540|nr:DUF3168 domain-containing protein [Mesorhizobium sp. M7A.F.Ca.ET.027.02.1.1]RVD15367.1 DUF3168 domain-containing protein [Mesorhizobium sp. M7A.F.Ca.ET.027.02.1.1]RWD08186.1 MAG: DUF3168 domain-containing protein [Mesorhizobium sp.]
MIGAEVQKALFAALNGVTLAGANVFDQVPEANPFPRITIGDEQVIDDGNTCQDGWEVFSDVHCWSRPDAGSKVEVKTLAGEVVTAVSAIVAIAGFSLVSIEHQTTRVFRDPDGLTEHAVVSFRALIDPA